MGFHFPNPGDIIRDIQNGVNHVRDQAVGQINGVLNNALNQVQSKLNYAQTQIGNNIKNGVNQIGGTVQHSIEQLENKVKSVEHDIELKANDGVHSIESKAKQLTTELEHDIEDAVLIAVGNIFKEGAKEAKKIVQSTKDHFDKLRTSNPELSEHIDAVSVSFQISAFNMSFDSFMERSQDLLDALDKIQSTSSFTRTIVKDLILGLGPSSMSLQASLGFALGIESEDLEIGASIDNIGRELISDIVDLVLEKLNVPE